MRRVVFFVGFAATPLLGFGIFQFWWGMWNRVGETQTALLIFALVCLLFGLIGLAVSTPVRPKP